MRVPARLAPPFALTLLLLVSAASALAAPTITEHPLPTKDQGPLGITAGPDGNVWFAESAGSGGIGRSTPSGTIVEFTTGLSGAAEGIVAGPDGNLWFTEPNSEKIGQITPTGTITEFPLAKPGAPGDVAVGSDGNLWFTVSSKSGAIGRITTEGVTTIYSIGLTPKGEPRGITAGPDGNLWFTESANPARIGRITTNGTITEYSAGLTANSAPRSIAAGPDGNLWFTESADPGRIGRITPAGAITEFSTGLTTNSQPQGITAANDGDLYFTEFKNPGRIGRITPLGAISEISTPTSNSQPAEIATGPDGNLWFTEVANHGQIGTLSVAPSVSAGSSSGVTERSATLKAAVGPNSQLTSYYFEYGTTSAYGSATSTSSAGSGATASAVSAAINGLTAATLYHFRGVATNGSGTTYGADQTVTTTTPPTAISQPATAVTLTGATLHGTVDPEGQATTYHFDWGTTLSYGSQVPLVDASVGSDSSEHPLQQSLGGLTPDTSYHFRVVATNCGGCAEGTTYGSDQTFASAPAPTAATEPARSVGQARATVTGAINPHGAATAYHFDWGETTAYGTRTPAVGANVGSDSVEHALAQNLTGLTPGTLYHYRIVATNCEGCAAGTVYGSDMTFTTESLPPSLLSTNGTSLSTLGNPLMTPARPLLGRTAVARVLSGAVLIRMPGSAPQPLAGAVNIPMGSFIDAAHGVVLVATAVDRAGHTQSATLWAGAFVIGQASTRHGMTTFTLAGRRTSRCLLPGERAARRAVAARSKSHRPVRGLWATDNHGHFSTRGQNSVATVRGTYWETVDRCDGTLTVVKRGAVSVRATHSRRAVLVTAGRSYLAKS